MRSDFEKLVIARRYIEMLEKERDLLKSEVELVYKQVKEAERALQAEKDRKEKMTAKEKLQVKSDLYVQQMRKTIENLRTKLKAATDENKKLVDQLIRLKLNKE